MLLAEVKEVFVLGADQELVSLQPAQFITEVEFQKMLEDYPNLLSGELINPEEPRRWVLVKREIGIPGEKDGSAWWSADHLFLDQDGIPTIVEVKLQSNPELRRKVVAQMLEYAANGVAYWPVEFIRSTFEGTCARNGKDPEQVLQSNFGLEIDSAKFWAQVKTNLEAQKIRLLFVADVIPRELKRLVEFLNLQMNSVEVLALELKQYVDGKGLRAIAPTLFGLTEKARSLKLGLPSRDWDEASFFERLDSRTTPAVVASARRILSWIQENTNGLEYGHGNLEGSVTGSLSANGLKLYPVSLWTSGKILINFNYCKSAPFDDRAKRLEFLKRLNNISGVNLASDCIDRQPPILISDLVADDKTDRFLEVLDWFAEQVKATQQGRWPGSENDYEAPVDDVRLRGGTAGVLVAK